MGKFLWTEGLGISGAFSAHAFSDLGISGGCVPFPMRLRVHYRGRVQGVGFRATVLELASNRPVTGWVRNEPDGSVLMEVQGDPDAVEAVLNAIYLRMGRNIVSKKHEDVAEQGHEHAFEIRR